MRIFKIFFKIIVEFDIFEFVIVAVPKDAFVPIKLVLSKVPIVAKDILELDVNELLTDILVTIKFVIVELVVKELPKDTKDDNKFDIVEEDMNELDKVALLHNKEDIDEFVIIELDNVEFDEFILEEIILSDNSDVPRYF